MKKFLYVLTILLALPLFASAATFIVEGDVGRETVNAIEGTLELPTGVSVEKIYTGDSAVLIWITKPVFDLESGTITFAGMTPGGFSGKRPMFTIETKGDSLAGFSSQTGSAYKNDGEGSPATIRFSLAESELNEDLEGPEPFVLNISSSPDIFESRKFLSFVAQDKNSGIERYEFAATWALPPSDSDWFVAESPYALSTSHNFKRLHIRAIDNEGNERTVSTGGAYWFLTLAFGLIIIVCLAHCVRRFFSSRS